MLNICFGFSCVWSFGGNLEKSSRNQFSKFFRLELFKHTGNLLKEFVNVYDFYYDFEQLKPKNWRDLIKEFVFDQ